MIVESQIENLFIQIHELQVSLEEEKKKNLSNNNELYNLIIQLNKIQDAYLKLSNKFKTIRYENKTLLKEMDIIIKNKKYLDDLCIEQSNEIERAIVLIKNYMKI